MERKYIVLLCFLGIAILYWIIAQTNWLQAKETIEESADGVKTVVKDENEITRTSIEKDGNKTREDFEEHFTRLEKVIQKSTLDDQNVEELLKKLLGDDYKNILLNKETFN